MSVRARERERERGSARERERERGWEGGRVTKKKLARARRARPVQYRPINATEYKAQYGNVDWRPGQVG